MKNESFAKTTSDFKKSVVNYFQEQALEEKNLYDKHLIFNNGNYSLAEEAVKEFNTYYKQTGAMFYFGGDPDQKFSSVDSQRDILFYRIK